MIRNTGHKDKNAAKANPFNKYTYEKGVHLGEWLKSEEFKEDISAGNMILHPKMYTAYLHHCKGFFKIWQGLRGAWQLEINKHDADMERMEEELAALKQTQEAEESAQDGTKKKTEQAMMFLEVNELTEDMKEKLIEKVVVYPGNRIEILWRFEEHLIN